jgi:glycerol-3-phosphate dehydrogenase (NAD(P)+)
MKHRVAVLGSGTMGTALANAVATSGRACVMWSADAELVRGVNETHRNPRHFSDQLLPPSLTATTSLEDAVGSAELAIIAVRSDGVRALAQRIAASVPPEQVLLSATKGLEPQTNKPMSQLLKEETRALVVGAISGPNITQDIMAHRPTGIVVASAGNAALARAVELIELPSLRIFGSSDLLGVEFLGALKNVVVIAAGLAAGLGLGDNARSFLITLGLTEIQGLALRLGARPATFTGLAGFGDLFLSSTSVYSRNHMVGVELGKGFTLEALLALLERLNETAEGVNTIRACRQIAAEHGLAMPLAERIHDIVFGGRPARAGIEQLLSDPGATKCLDAD